MDMWLKLHFPGIMVTILMAHEYCKKRGIVEILISQQASGETLKRSRKE